MQTSQTSDPNLFHYVFHENKNLLFTIHCAAWLAGRLIPNYVDPQGCELKRDLIKRFFTITLPDNAPISLLLWLGRAKDITYLCEPGGVCALALLVCSGAQLIEFARKISAFGIDKFGEYYGLGENIRIVASMVGPRDFYASRLKEE